MYGIFTYIYHRNQSNVAKPYMDPVGYRLVVTPYKNMVFGPIFFFGEFGELLVAHSPKIGEKRFHKSSKTPPICSLETKQKNINVITELYPKRKGEGIFNDLFRLSTGKEIF